MNYFGIKSQNSPSAGGSVPRLPFRFNDQRMCKILLPLNISFWLKMQGNLGAKQNFIFLVPTPCPKKRSRATDGTASFSLFCVRAQGTLAT